MIGSFIPLPKSNSKLQQSFRLCTHTDTDTQPHTQIHPFKLTSISFDTDFLLQMLFRPSNFEWICDQKKKTFGPISFHLVYYHIYFTRLSSQAKNCGDSFLCSHWLHPYTTRERCCDSHNEILQKRRIDNETRLATHRICHAYSSLSAFIISEMQIAKDEKVWLMFCFVFAIIRFVFSFLFCVCTMHMWHFPSFIFSHSVANFLNSANEVKIFAYSK